MDRRKLAGGLILLACGVLALVLTPPVHKSYPGDTDLHEFEALKDSPEAEGAYQTAQDRLRLFGCLSIPPLVLTASVVTGHFAPSEFIGGIPSAYGVVPLNRHVGGVSDPNSTAQLAGWPALLLLFLLLRLAYHHRRGAKRIRPM